MIAFDESRQPLVVGTNHITYNTGVSVRTVRFMVWYTKGLDEFRQGSGVVLMTVPSHSQQRAGGHRPMAARLRLRPHALQYVSLSTRRHMGVLLTPHTKHTCSSPVQL